MLKDWFFQLNDRERWLVSSAAALTVVLLIFLLAVVPLLSGTKRAEQQVTDKKALLAELDELAARLGPGAGGSSGPAAGADQSLVVLVDRTTRSAGLSGYVKRNQPDGSSNIRLRLENAPFDELMEWLANLKSQYGLIAMSANIDTAQDVGRVNCNLVLTRTTGG